MSKLPMSWSAIPLGQEIELKKGKKPKLLHVMPNEGFVPYVDIKAFEKGNIRQYADQNSGVNAEANDTLMVWDGARSGLVGNGIAGVIGSTLMRIRPMSSNRNYLHHFLKSKFNQINSNTKGTGIPHVSPEFLYGIDIPLAPLPEQKRISDKLDAVLARVDACRDRLDRIPVILKRFRQSVLATATSGKLTEDWRDEFDFTVSPDDVVAERRLRAKKDSERKALEAFLAEYAPVPGDEHGLPATWVATNVGSIGIVNNGSTPSRQIDTYWGGDIAWVSSGEVRNTVISSTRERITSDGYENSSVRILPKGTVLIAMIGEGKTRGQSALLDIVACINQNIAGVVPIESIIDSKYLWYWFQAQYENNRLVGSGTGPQALNCQRVRELPVNLPPLHEQTEIVCRIETLFVYADRLETRYNAARSQVEKLTPSILAKAFRGELVPQDPKDEPTSELLERIFAQHVEKAVKKHKRT